jgi:chitodextrinase
VLVALVALALSALPAATAHAAAGGMVAAYSFDEGSGTTLGDQSGNGHPGTVVGATWAAGKYGSALSFNGISSRVDLPPLGTFYKTGFTLEAWVDKSTAKKDVGILGSWDYPGGGPMLWVDHIAGHHYVTLSAGLENYLDSGQAPSTGQWQYLSATYDGTTARYYIDGVQVASRAFAANVGDTDVWRIGAYGTSPYGFFDGLIDDVRIYNRALTTPEVQGDMTQRVGQDTVAPTAPTGFAKTGATSTSIATSWTASTDNVGVVGYRLFRGGTEIATTASTSYTFTGLTCNTSYELGVEAFDDGGNVSPRTPLTASTGECDTTPPTVSVTAPANGATVGGTITVSAAASDNTSVAGVQFKLDGANLASEDTSSPYSVGWDTATSSPGTHTVSAVARDSSGNTATSAPVTVTVAAPPAGSAPIAAYSFDDGAGTIAGDASGHSRQGTIVGATWATGKFGSALSFNGTSARVDLPDLGRFYKLGFTLEAWVKKTSAKSDVGIVGTWNAAQNGGPMLWIDNALSHYYLTLNAGSSNYVDSGQGPVAGQWQHIAATYDGSTARVFVNGTQVASQPFTANAGDSGNWRIGAYGPTPAGFFDGLIDEVRIYDRALTAAQIQGDMNAPVAAGPAVIAATPENGSTGASAAPSIRAWFNVAMSAGTVSSSRFQLRNAAGTLVPSTVTYDAATGTASLAVTGALAYGATYTATVTGGSNGVKDAGGDPMASNRSWSFTVTPQPPILLVTSAARPFSTYAGEILKAEGLAEYTSLDVSYLTPAVLNGFDEVVLGDAALTGAQVTTLSDWVAAGGNLIALRPDKKLASLLGLADLGATLANGYLKVDTTTGTPGAGIVDQTIQYHGSADRYALNGATAVATLYSNSTTATASPAVTLRSVGINGGQAAAFTYDLASSVVYTRQGNPAWVAQERDGNSPIRPDDLFFGAKAGNLQPDWVDLSKVAIPQADEQQRLLANLITLTGQDRKPVPRFWYLPNGHKAAVVMTGDDHAEGGTAGRFDKYIASSPPGCSSADWECVRSTSYIYPASPLTNAQAQSYTAQGFEVALHVAPVGINQIGCSNWTAAGLPGIFDTQLAVFRSKYANVAAPVTHRMHCVAWSDWATQPKVELANGIRLDANYYYYPGSWIAAKPGFMTGSGLPMRFADSDGSLIDVFQANTEITDESGQGEPSTINALLDGATGATGYYGAFVANIHTDHAASTDSDAIVAAAQARGVPVISAKQLLDWTDGRETSSLSSFGWSSNTLSFNVQARANGLQGMLPTESGTRTLQSITVNGNVTVPFTTRTVKGISYAFFDALSGSYTAVYA